MNTVRSYTCMNISHWLFDLAVWLIHKICIFWSFFAVFIFFFWSFTFIDGKYGLKIRQKHHFWIHNISIRKKKLIKKKSMIKNHFQLKSYFITFENLNVFFFLSWISYQFFVLFLSRFLIIYGFINKCWFSKCYHDFMNQVDWFKCSNLKQRKKNYAEFKKKSGKQIIFIRWVFFKELIF